MTVRARVLIAFAAVAVPVLLAPLLLQPVYAIALVCAAVVVALAFRSIAYPIGLAGLPAVAIGLSGGTNPFPPGTIALFGAGWAAIAIFATVVRRDDELPLRVLLAAPVIASVLLTVWLLVRLGSSLDPAYGSRKLQLFVAGNVISLLAGILIARRRSRFELYVFVALLMAGLSSLALARGLLSGQHANVGGRFSITADDSPIGLGRDAARGILFAVFVLLASKATWLRVLAFGALPLVVVALLASGSRGPLVGLVVGLVTLFLLTLGDRAARGRLLLVVGGIVIAVFLVPQLVPGQNATRALSIFSGRSEGLSSNGRTHLWHEAWQIFTAHPLFGIGTGSFGHFEPVELFPHNILLETAVELGLVGLLLTLVVIFATGLLGWRAWRVSAGDDRAHASVVLALFVSALVNACLSSDIAANDALWLASGLAVGISQRLDLALAQPFVAMRALRRTRREAGARRPGAGPLWPERHGPPAVQAPRIIAPQANAVLAGLVTVEVAAPRTGRPIAQVRIEWSTGSGWSRVAERDERTFDVSVGTEAAIVRSQWLADLFAAALGTRAQPSRRRPWAAPAVYGVEWDTAAVPPGSGAIRAVAVDADGREVASDEVGLSVRASTAAPAAGVEDERAQIIRRIRETRSAAAEQAARETALEERAVAIERESAALNARARVVEALRTGAETERAAAAAARAELDQARAALAERESALAEHERDLVARRQEAEAQVSELALRADELEQLQSALARREDAHEDQVAELANRRAEAKAQADELAELRSELASRAETLAEREAASTATAEELAATAAEIETLQRDVDEQRALLATVERELAERAAEAAATVPGLAARAAEVEQLRATIETQRTELAAREREIAEHEARVISTASQREAELAATALELEQLRSTVEAQRAQLAAREVEVTEHETRVVSTASERESALAATAAELQQLRATVEEQRTQLAAREREIAEHEERVVAAASELEQLRSTVEEQRTQLAAREREIAEHEERVASTATEREVRLEELRASVEAERAAVEARRAELAADERALMERASDLTGHETTLAERERELVERETRVVSTISEREARVDELQTALDRDRRALEDRERAKAAELAEQRTALAAREAEVAELQAELERTLRPPVVRLAVPALPLRGEVALDVDLEHVEGDVVFEVQAGPAWRALPAAAGLFDTTTLAEGVARVRAVVGDTASNPVDVVVDNRPPRVRIVEPAQGVVVSGTVVPVVEATDEATSVHSVLLQRSQDGSSWRPVIGTAWNTEADADGEWLLRATAVDEARNVGRSEIVRLVVRNVVPELVPEPEWEPEPVFEPEPSRLPAQLIGTGARPSLFELEAATAAVADRDRRDALDAILFYLRDYADVDGALPPQFDSLIDQEFGDLARLA